MHAQEIKHVVIEEAEHTKTRYTPFMEKCLARLAHSKEVWAEEKKATEDNKAEGEAKMDALIDVKSKSFDVWDAAVRGKTELIKRFIEETSYDVRRHNDQPPYHGDTLLHVAVWNGHVSLVEFLIEHVTEVYGTDDADDFVNAFDTIANQATPLILAARTQVGVLNDRLEICKALVNAGANIEAQDTFGDTALHWAARVSSLPIVRYFIKGTDGVIFAANADNFQREKALDVAAKVDYEAWKQADDCERDTGNIMWCTVHNKEHYSTYQTLEIYNLLLALMKGCNMRLKIQKGKQRRLEDEARRGARLKEQRNKAIANAAHLLEKCKKEFFSQGKRAEEQRQKEEDAELDKVGQAAIEKMERYAKTKEGKQKLKDLQGNHERTMTEEARIAGEKIVKKDIKRIALAKAKAQMYGEAEEDARRLARMQFRERNAQILPHMPKPGEFKDIRSIRKAYADQEAGIGAAGGAGGTGGADSSGAAAAGKRGPQAMGPPGMGPPPS